MTRFHEQNHSPGGRDGSDYINSTTDNSSPAKFTENMSSTLLGPVADNRWNQMPFDYIGNIGNSAAVMQNEGHQNSSVVNNTFTGSYAEASSRTALDLLADYSSPFKSSQPHPNDVFNDNQDLHGTNAGTTLSGPPVMLGHLKMPVQDLPSSDAPSDTNSDDETEKNKLQHSDGSPSPPTRNAMAATLTRKKYVRVEVSKQPFTDAAGNLRSAPQPNINLADSLSDDIGVKAITKKGRRSNETTMKLDALALTISNLVKNTSNETGVSFDKVLDYVRKKASPPSQRSDNYYNKYCKAMASLHGNTSKEDLDKGYQELQQCEGQNFKQTIDAMSNIVDSFDGQTTLVKRKHVFQNTSEFLKQKLNQFALIYGFQSVLLLAGDNIRVDTQGSSSMFYESAAAKGYLSKKLALSEDDILHHLRSYISNVVSDTQLIEHRSLQSKQAKNVSNDQPIPRIPVEASRTNISKTTTTISEDESPDSEPIYDENMELVLALPDDFQLRSVSEAKVRRWTTQAMCELLDEKSISFRGKSSGKPYTTFPWKDLSKQLKMNKLVMTDWPFDVRFPGDKSLSKPSFSGLEKTEVYVLANALLKHRIKLLPWPKKHSDALKIVLRTTKDPKGNFFEKDHKKTIWQVSGDNRVAIKSSRTDFVQDSNSELESESASSDDDDNNSKRSRLSKPSKRSADLNNQLKARKRPRKRYVEVDSDNDNPEGLARSLDGAAGKDTTSKSAPSIDTPATYNAGDVNNQKALASSSTPRDPANIMTTRQRLARSHKKRNEK